MKTKIADALKLYIGEVKWDAPSENHRLTGMI